MKLHWMDCLAMIVMQKVLLDITGVLELKLSILLLTIANISR